MSKRTAEPLMAGSRRDALIVIDESKFVVDTPMGITTIAENDAYPRFAAELTASGLTTSVSDDPRTAAGSPGFLLVHGVSTLESVLSAAGPETAGRCFVLQVLRSEFAALCARYRVAGFVGHHRYFLWKNLMSESGLMSAVGLRSVAERCGFRWSEGMSSWGADHVLLDEAASLPLPSLVAEYLLACREHLRRPDVIG